MDHSGSAPDSKFVPLAPLRLDAAMLQQQSRELRATPSGRAAASQVSQIRRRRYVDESDCGHDGSSVTSTRSQALKWGALQDQESELKKQKVELAREAQHLGIVGTMLERHRRLIENGTGFVDRNDQSTSSPGDGQTDEDSQANGSVVELVVAVPLTSGARISAVLINSVLVYISILFCGAISVCGASVVAIGAVVGSAIGMFLAVFTLGFSVPVGTGIGSTLAAVISVGCCLFFGLLSGAILYSYRLFLGRCRDSLVYVVTPVVDVFLGKVVRAGRLPRAWAQLLLARCMRSK